MRLVQEDSAAKELIKNQLMGGRHLTAPIEITDPKLVRAYAHPLRIQILALLDNRIASPREIADELGSPLSNTAYHVRQLVGLGLVELVRRTARRGAIEHHYTAKVRPTITDEGWAKLPAILKRAIADGNVQRTLGRVVSATQRGGFDREDSHHSLTAGLLDTEGWTSLSRDLAQMLNRIEEVVAESEARLERDPQKAAIHATIVLMLFECHDLEAVASPHGAKGKRGRKGADDAPELDLDDVLPPGA